MGNFSINVFRWEAWILLKYLWTVMEDLLLTVTLVTLMHTLLGRLYGRRGRVFHWAGIGAGLAASVVLAVLKNTTKLIISSRWNHWIYGVIFGFTMAFLLLSWLFGRKESAAWRAGGALLCAAGAGWSAGLIFFETPAVMAYPFNFNTMGQGVFSWYYGERLLGWLTALVLLLVYSRMLYHCALRIKKFALLPAALRIGTASFAVYCFGMFFAPWITRAKWLGWSVAYDARVPLHKAVRDLCMFVSKHALLFTWIAMGLALLLAVCFFAENVRVSDPYDNPAQLRKLRSRNRQHRRRAATVAVSRRAAWAIWSSSTGTYWLKRPP